MSLTIQVIKASNLPNLEKIGKSDPYVHISFQGEKRKTEVRSSTLDPEWDETLTWDLGSGKPPQPDECIDIIVKDYERLGWNRVLAKGTIVLRNVLHSAGQPLDYELSLVDAKDLPTASTLSLTISYKPVAGAGQQKQQVTGTAGGQQAARVAGATSDFGGTQPDLIPDVGVEGVGGGGRPSMMMQKGRPRDLLPTTKTKFQVRVRLVEGRQLLGANINPVCRVSLRGTTKQSRVHRSTTSPWFDEIFFFQEEEVPTTLLEEPLLFKVCNSSRLRTSTIIGAFKFELGMIYDQPNHAFVNRWLVLANPDEPTPTVQGYLKVSVAVLGPGDAAPEMEARRCDQDDVETNLLWPAGVHLQPANFRLSVYSASDLPRMDAGTMQTLKQLLGIGVPSKELVDPYVLTAYAGKEVQTKILYTTENPQFKQDLHLGFLFPSMCNTIRITVKDWDRVGDDDTVGTAVIPVSAISTAGDDGFLPTFGPAYVNLYGWRRDWELLEGERAGQMNEGDLEGCSYRGRVLLALHTNIGTYPASPVSNMDVIAIAKAKKFCSTRKFIVQAAFSHASMLSSIDVPLEFEVSVGNFGNKLENSLLPSPSTTHPTNAVFDGCKYYFLPWMETTPYIVVHCHWEDISHRLEAVNIINNAADTLEKNLLDLRTALRSSRPQEEPKDVAKIFVALVKKLIEDCRVELPEADPILHAETSLDRQLRKRRKRELDRLVEDAEALKNSATDPEKALSDLQEFLSILRDLAIEPQSSIPDVLLWLMSGTQRIAYVRVPAHKVLHSDDARKAGALSGRFHTFTLRYPEDPPGSQRMAGVVRASLWLGREEDAQTWWTIHRDLEPAVFAETYENQVCIPGAGKWTTKGPLMSRPIFSDADGILDLPKESFKAPQGWQFESEWFIDPDPSLYYAADEGHSQFVEDVYEQEVRVPGGTWIPSPTHWADVRGDPATARDIIQCPLGWRWADIWTLDVRRAVDGEGWEYTVDASLSGYSPQEKVYHISRRRRWTRTRNLVEKVEQKESGPVEGWEYATHFKFQFHAMERKVDLVRRRRWRRKLKAVTEGRHPPLPIFALNVDADKESDVPLQLTCPRMYLGSSQQHRYQLRAHLYQARDLPAGDKTGFSDPYACVSFCSSSQKTELQRATLCPTWDQTLLFDDVIIAGPPATTRDQPPEVIIEVYDHDAYGEPDFLGRAFCKPVVFESSNDYTPPKLQWFTLARGSKVQGELLASFELMLKVEGEEVPMLPPKRGELLMVPFGVRPVLQTTRIEILCWGVRNMKTFDLKSVTRPSIEFECGGQRVTSAVMKDTRINPNFDSPHLYFDVELPREELYMPPLTLRVMDHRAFGSRPVVATAVVPRLHHYVTTPRAATRESVTMKKSLMASTKDSQIKPGTMDTDIDWWCKFYASLGDSSRCGAYLRKGYERLSILPGALEEVKAYRNFTDLLDTIPLTRGKGSADSDPEVAGELKGTFRVYPMQGEEAVGHVLSGFPPSSPQEVTARVYVIQGKDLTPKDAGGLADPYVIVSLGKETQSSKDEYRPNTLNPIFGHVFEVKATLPLQKDLKISVWDYDLLSTDDLIGETKVDLENRFLTRFRATCGLPKAYHVSGPNAWRDREPPSEILHTVARLHNLEGPRWSQDHLQLTLGDSTYTLDQFEPEGTVLPPSLGSPSERLALHALHASAAPLVEEHVESRTLYHSGMPGLPQGKLLMWVDLFPTGPDLPPLPPPVEITPRRPQNMVLRVVIYNAYGVPLQETNLAGEQMSDVYVKAWLQGTKNVQKTDIHYRCMDGDANFNWRMLFPLEYLEAEQSMVIKRREHTFSLDKTEERRPPQLTLQLWDNDLLLSDDYLSELTLDLCTLPRPARSPEDVTLSMVSRLPLDKNENQDATSVTVDLLEKGEEVTFVSLFEKKRVCGFFPCVSTVDGAPQIGGTLELELEVLTEEEAAKRPAGHGRDDPNMNPKLEEPKRPATSFFWLTSPWKSFKFVMWKNYKWYIITFIILFFLFLFLFLLLYSLPGATIDYLIGVD
ncbi:myoferlin-like isoform X2 [Oratosquilla oratoria]|uniref:myoferlin-like isoform X2 n=1 Tax=Oratosquilla oratoria TaxID=337810 RepID=UPI003F762161